MKRNSVSIGVLPLAMVGALRMGWAQEESLAIELARERAALRRLLREFGSQHPTVTEARERVRQLEHVQDR